MRKVEVVTVIEIQRQGYDTEQSDWAQNHPPFSSQERTTHNH